MARHAELSEIQLPDFGMPTFEPEIPAEVYRKRLRKLYVRSIDTDYVIVYGDREHSANIAYLTGYDPRFEEALLILPVQNETQKPTLLVGNEGMGYVNSSPIKEEIEVVLYQEFSLMGQPRESSKSLDQILRDAGLQSKIVVWIIGWKYSDQAIQWNYPAMDTVRVQSLEIPAYIVDTIRNIVQEPDFIENASSDLMEPRYGMRVQNEVEQLARFEFAACFTSQALRNVLFGLKPGMTEFEAVQLMGLNGLPLSCHLMLSAGPRAFMGLPSPSMRKIGRGEPFTMAYGVWGALNARAGWVAESAAELPADIQDYVEKLVKPYFEAIVAWYEHIGIGVTGGELYDIIHECIGDPFFGVTLNPGHYIHLDEWVHSPIYKGSDIQLKSGMALQVDVIPATGTPYFTTNIEDGIALADETLRQAFATKYPEAWGRIQARRTFMENSLGIRLKPEVLPFSNIPAYLPPFLLSPHRTMRMVD